MRRRIIFALFISLVILIGCAKTNVDQEQFIGKGSSVEQQAKQEVSKPNESSFNIPQDMKDILANSAKIRKIQYYYSGPETGTGEWLFFIDGKKIIYEPKRETKYPYKPDWYDSVVIDLEAKTAEAHCLGDFCFVKGKKLDLDYSKDYIKTIFDWTANIQKAEKIGEEVFEGRKTWKVNTNNGILWLDEFYGVPLRVESGEKIYSFKQVKADTEIPLHKIPIDIKKLINNSAKLKSLEYNYKGPESGDQEFEFFVMGDKIRYVPYRRIKSLDKPESFDSIIIDRVAQSAISYCFDATCKFKGKRSDLPYDSNYILTPFDWITFIVESEKIGEQVIDSRNTLKIQTNKGIMWIDEFYGVPLQVEYNGESYRFRNIKPNAVEESEVVANLA